MIIKIGNKEVELKKSMRSLMYYEQLTGKSFAPQGITDIINYMYSVVMSSDRTLNITLDDFIDLLDETPELIGQFSEWLQKSYAVDAQLGKGNKEKKAKAVNKK